jgi:hypothetical protein
LKSGKFDLPPLFSPSINGKNRSTPKKMSSSSSSRLPFSPLTNSLNKSIARRNIIENSSDGSSIDDISREKRVLHFDSTSSKKARPIIAKNQKGSDRKRSDEEDNFMQEQVQVQEQVQEQAPETDHEVQVEMEPSYEFKYPKKVKLSSSVLHSAYNQAMQYGTHQRHLHESNCNQLSFTEVLIPSIIRAHNRELKKFEGKAKGRKAISVVKEIQSYRCMLKSCEVEMITSAEQARDESKNTVRIHRREAAENKLEQKREEAANRQRELVLEKTERKEHKLKEKEMKREQQKKNYKRNKELWREVAFLMRELGTIEKEERMWREIDLKDFTEKFSVGIDLNLHKEGDIACLSEMKSKELSVIQGIVDGITTSANRIEEALQDLPSVLDKAETVKSEVYQKYKKDHKFDGYRAHKDPRALIRALTLD